MDFDWDDANIEHILERDVEIEEAQDVFYNPRYKSAWYEENNERRQDLVGITDGGRILRVVYTDRAGKHRVCAAFDANVSEKKEYKKRFPDAE